MNFTPELSRRGKFVGGEKPRTHLDPAATHRPWTVRPKTMSSVFTTVQKTQIVVSAHSDDDEPEPVKAQPSSPLNIMSASAGRGSEPNPLSHKYPHTRSCLLGIIREYRVDGDADSDETESLLHQVISFLKDDNAEELRNTLKASIELSEDAVSIRLSWPSSRVASLLTAHRMFRLINASST